MQRRIKSGSDFEYKITDDMGWTLKRASPKIAWKTIKPSGDITNKFELIKALNFNVDNLSYDDKLSLYDKYDAVTNEGNIEIKSITSNKFKRWQLYSEPAFKIASYTDVWNLISASEGKKILDTSLIPKNYRKLCQETKSQLKKNVIQLSENVGIKEKYNKFIDDLFVILTSDYNDVLTKIINSSIGIQTKDKFIPKSELEFKWRLKKKAWGGFHRIEISCKLK